MNGVEFLDTNILVYSQDVDAGSKHDIAEALVLRLFDEQCGALSTQVLVEFYSVMTRKWRMPLLEAEEALADYADWDIHCATYSDLLRASQLHRRHSISWWDALVVNSAIELGCAVLWTEDLAHGQQFGPVKVRNPFRNELQ